VQNAAWIAGVGDVVADLDEEFAEAEDVGVDVVADVGLRVGPGRPGSSGGHAAVVAREEFS